MATLRSNIFETPSAIVTMFVLVICDVDLKHFLQKPDCIGHVDLK